MSVSTRNTLPLPPFGRILEAYCAEKIRFPYQIHIYIGTTEKNRNEILTAKRWGGMLTYLPNNTAFSDYRWPVENQNVLIFDLAIREADFARQFAAHLIKNYSPKTVVIQSEHYPFKIFSGVKNHG